MWLGPLTDVE